ncbi:MAG: hypothetical protein FGM33_01745 [Candidatus Kapabacteria bacterium]|nr:hypothetical protein [Candidatus Kapabacteria bacterium]
MFRMRTIVILTILAGALAMLGCDAIHFMDRKRTMTLSCRRDSKKWLATCENVLGQNGYVVVDRDAASNMIIAQDTITDVEYRYTMLVRTFRIQHTGDSAFVDVYSVSTRLDGSDVTQTWDKKWAGEEVKSWMRPILSQIEASCGTATPLGPSDGR